MGARTSTLQQRPQAAAPVTPASQALVMEQPNGGMDPAGTPSSGYDALAESRKRIAAAAGRRSLFAGAAGGTSAVLGAN